MDKKKFKPTHLRVTMCEEKHTEKRDFLERKRVLDVTLPAGFVGKYTNSFAYRRPNSQLLANIYQMIIVAHTCTR